MKLRARISRTLLLSLLAAMAIILPIAELIVLRGFQKIEDERARSNVERAVRAIERRASMLLASVKDWSMWDDMYKFISGTYPEFARENIVPVSFANLGVDVVIGVDDDGRILWSGEKRGGDIVPLEPSSELIQQIQNHGPLSRFDHTAGFHAGAIQTERGVYLIAVRPVRNSAGEGPGRGALLMGRRMDEAFVAEVAADLKMPVSLHPLSAPSRPDLTEQQNPRRDAVARVSGTDTVEGWAAIRGTDGEPVAWVRVDTSRAIHRHGIRTFALFAVTLLIGSAVFVAGAMRLLRRHVLVPVETLKAQTDRLIDDPNAAVVLALPDASDELKALAEHVNNLVRREREARAEIEAGQQRYARMFHALIFGYALHELVFDNEGRAVDYRFIEVNPAFERLTGLRAADVVGRTAREVLPSLDASWIERYSRVAETGEPASFEEWSDALKKYFAVSAYRTAPGQFAVIFDDSTARYESDKRIRALLQESNEARLALQKTLEDERRAHEALDESRSRYRELFENMPSAVSHCRMLYENGKPVDFITLNVNPAFYRIMKLGNVVGRRAGDVIPGIQTSNPELFEQLDRVVRTGTPATFEVYIAALGIWLFVAAHRPAEGEFVAVFNDITERKQSEQQHRLQSAALEAAANPMVITNREGTIEWVNPAFTAGTGYTLEEAKGRNPNELVNSGQQSREFYEDMWQTILAGGVWHGELVNRRKNGSLFTEEMTITPVRGDSGQIENFVAVKQDVTGRKEAEARLYRAQRVESVGRLASGIAHDINNILTPVLMAPPILREAIQDPSVLSLVDAIEISAKRGAAIVKQLLAFGRGTTHERAPVSLRALVKDMSRIIEETFPKNIRLNVSLPDDVALVTGDATQIHQVLMNLCLNARDAMPDGGTLSVSVDALDVSEDLARLHTDAHAGRHVRIRISDTGTGIAPEHLDHIFEPFYSTKPIGEGTGLGLPTVLSIVRGHEGFLDVESQPGRGTTMTVYLPQSRELSEAAATGPSPVYPRGHGELILIVDDEPQVRTVMEHALMAHGYRCQQAGNGEDALRALAAKPGEARVVITDLMMPEMDGPALVGRLRKEYPSLPVIAISGVLDHRELLHRSKADADVFLHKPYDMGDLLMALRQVLRAA